jgi:PIN domain nuclease of toxin-antitoxin system
MKLLLDTHAFLWYITDDDHLSRDAAEAIRQETNEVYLSVVSMWEVLAKHQLGKLQLPAPADLYLQDQRHRHGILSLAFEEPALLHLLRLPLHHRDPFDRMLICQALQHQLSVITVDEQFSRYPVSIFRPA